MKRDYAAAAEQNNQLQLSPPPHHRLAADNSPTPNKANSGTENALDFQLPPPSNYGATTDVSRRPRGRPPGSKNRPKPPSVVERDSSQEPSVNPYVLQIPPGVDVVETTTRFCRRKGIGLCVLCGNGAVSNVTLKQPSTIPGRTVTFQGQYDIHSISGTVLPGGEGYPPAATDAPFAVTLAGPQGKIFGGLLAGPLLSAGTIYLTAATFNCPSFERLQTTDQEDAAVAARDGGRESQQAVSGGEIGGGPIYSYQAAARDGGRESQQAVFGGEIGGGPIYSYQAADVVWAPSARQPHY